MRPPSSFTTHFNAVLHVVEIVGLVVALLIVISVVSYQSQKKRRLRTSRDGIFLSEIVRNGTIEQKSFVMDNPHLSHDLWVALARDESSSIRTGVRMHLPSRTMHENPRLCSELIDILANDDSGEIRVWLIRTLARDDMTRFEDVLVRIAREDPDLVIRLNAGTSRPSVLNKVSEELRHQVASLTAAQQFDLTRTGPYWRALTEEALSFARIHFKEEAADALLKSEHATELARRAEMRRVPKEESGGAEASSTVGGPSGVG